MIIFELTCGHGHRFEGWFASGEEFARQQERALVTCPVCDDAHVELLAAVLSEPPESIARRRQLAARVTPTPTALPTRRRRAA